MSVTQIRFMPNRNTSKPLKYLLTATIIARNKRYIKLKFYQVLRNARRANVFSNACLDTDSLQKRMSLSALVPACNGSRNGLNSSFYFATMTCCFT